MSIFRYEVAAPAPGRDSIALFLVFAPSRGRVLSAELRVGDPQISVSWIPAAPVPERSTSWRIPLEGTTFPPGPAPVVRLATLDEPLAPAYFVEDLGTQRRVWTDDHKGSHGRRRFVSQDSSVELRELLLDPVDYANVLRRSIRRRDAGEQPLGASEPTQPPPVDREELRKYFVLLELASSPDSSEVTQQTRRDVAVVTQHLQRRVRQRALVSRLDPSRAGEPLAGEPTPTLRQCVARLSTLQLTLIDACFTGSNGKFDSSKFASAFEAFSNGDLRNPVTPAGLTSPAYFITEPSSAFYLYFAEFAFLACECGVDAERWEALARPMAYTQRIFAKVYGPDRPNPRFADFVAANFHPHKQLSAAQIGNLRSSADPLDLPGLRRHAAGTVRQSMASHGAALVPT